MITDLFLSLPNNIIEKINFLKQDYVGLGLNLDVLVNLTLGFIIAISFLIISLLIGQKIRNLLFKDVPENINYLIDIGLGTIAVGTGIALLGFFSLLNSFVLLSYLILLLIISFYKFQPKYLGNARKKLLFSLKLLKQNKFVFLWLCLFIFIAFINLINPEIREDQYHVDFPKIYLEQQTIMVPPKEGLRVSASPLLSEMTYLIGIFLWSNESARYIHFIFYILTLLTLIEFSKLKNYKFSIYAPLLFATAPVVIHETSSVYVDFQWIFFFLLSILVLIYNKKNTYSTIGLSGLLMGAMLASKLWTIVFIPVSIFFIIFITDKIQIKLKFAALFTVTCLIIPSIWLLRSLLLTGSPLYPAFVNDLTLENKVVGFSLLNFFGLNYTILNPLSYINVFSPLFFLGLLLFFYQINKNLRLILKLAIFRYFILLLLLYLSLRYQFGRYLLGLYVLFIFLASVGIDNFLKKFKYSKYLINFILVILFSYYLINSLLVIPYSIGITDKNKYLTRILSRDNSSYYDFGKKFDKYISKNDFVATYKIFGYYYANFQFSDVNFILNKNDRDFDTFKEKGFTKIFIKDFNMEEFCKNIKIKNCDSSKYALISSYNDFPNYYLYTIK